MISRHKAQSLIKHCHFFVFWDRCGKYSCQKKSAKKSLQIGWSTITAKLISIFKLYFYSTFLLVMTEIRLEMHFNAKLCNLFVCKMQQMFQASGLEDEVSSANLLLSGTVTGLEITAGQWTMSGQNWVLTGQILGLPGMLSGHFGLCKKI